MASRKRARPSPPIFTEAELRDEEWRPADAHGRLEVSNLGRVRELFIWHRSGGWLKLAAPRLLDRLVNVKGAVVRPSFGASGGRAVSEAVSVVTLVAGAFLPPRPSSLSKNVFRYKNGNALDCRASNVEWTHPAGDVAKKYAELFSLGKIPLKQIAAETGTPPSVIQDVMRYAMGARAYALAVKLSKKTFGGRAGPKIEKSRNAERDIDARHPESAAVPQATIPASPPREEWRPVADFPGVDVSSLGRVRKWFSTSAPRRRLGVPELAPMRTRTDSAGNVVAFAAGVTAGTKEFFIAREVARAFVIRRSPAERGDAIVKLDYVNGDRADCRAENLRCRSFWMTATDDQIEKAACMFEDGATLSQVAKAIGCDDYAARKLLIHFDEAWYKRVAGPRATGGLPRVRGDDDDDTVRIDAACEEARAHAPIPMPQYVEGFTAQELEFIGENPFRKLLVLEAKKRNPNYRALAMKLGTKEGFAKDAIIQYRLENGMDE